MRLLLCCTQKALDLVLDFLPTGCLRRVRISSVWCSHSGQHRRTLTTAGCEGFVNHSLPTKSARRSLNDFGQQVELLLNSLAIFFAMEDLHQLLLVTPDPIAAARILSSMIAKAAHEGLRHERNLRVLVEQKVMMCCEHKLSDCVHNQ